MARTTFSVRLPDTLQVDINALAKSMNRSRGYVAEKALTEYVKWNAWKSRKIKAALSEADKGVFISHDAMTAWVGSLHTEQPLPAPKPDVFLNPRVGGG